MPVFAVVRHTNLARLSSRKRAIITLAVDPFTPAVRLLLAQERLLHLQGRLDAGQDVADGMVLAAESLRAAWAVVHAKGRVAA